MESNSLELKVMYCKDLKAFNFFQTLSVYAVVSIVSDDPTKKLHQQQHRTPTDKEGDGNPEWNHEMRFDLGDNTSIFYQDSDHLFLHFDLRSEGLLVFGDKSIGEVHVPFKDLVQDFNGIVRFVSYEVRSSDGKPNGVLNFTYKVKEKGMSTGNQIDGYPIHHDHHHHHTHSSPEMHQSTPEVVPSPFSLSSSQVHYPSLDLQFPSQEGYYSQENFYYLPPPQSLLPPVLLPPPPPPTHFPPPPPPFHVAHGAVYQNPSTPWVYPDDHKPYEFARGDACCVRNNVVEQQFGALADFRDTAHPNYYNGAGIGRDQDSRS
ncbi:hypothetical protein F0562_004749 [Nyssa sinensis]|uniref:C2 domain-containing protein n=1 Tax=Nyssa sinensis TaxID=561372 RepID=A0A5J5AHI0_9ASTE|nr:hypothetical protein F0562_004749 [Nyssa sinensis]